eukprot:TRINITY_DN72942_c0_g1_i1.p1 TRINITY_DN72942_c0_g1~~TRINITY_DN72942_c0_g1_i1.p1  ORF type:complete len:468 (+),score=78.86 TRINITY_DN72942_c0_g1_i1:103-1506(+)
MGRVPRYALCIVSIMCSSSAELLNVFILQRHGNRAPNTEVLTTCPNVAGTTVDDIKKAFKADPGQLTPFGEKLMEETGKFFHNHYFGGDHPKMSLPVDLDHKDRGRYFTFGATTTTRHHESVRLVSEQLFPGAAKPPGIVVDDAPDDFLACPPAVCVAANHMDASAWMASNGKSVYSKRKPCVREIEKICGRNFTDSDMDATASNPHPPFQDVVDLLKFRAQSGLPLPSHTDSVLDQARQIQYQAIQQRLFGTDEQVVYWMGEVPQRLLETFSSTEKHFGVYVTSREKLYAAEEFFGFEFNCGGILPTGAIYPGTALIFELHRREDGGKDVQVGYYYPPGHPTGDPSHKGAMKWLTLPGCGRRMCDFDTFSALIRQRSKVHGKDFRQICSEKEALSMAAAQAGGSAISMTVAQAGGSMAVAQAGGSMLFVPLPLAGALFAVFAVAVSFMISSSCRSRRRDYIPLGDA